MAAQDKNKKAWIDAQIKAGSTKTRAQLGSDYDDLQSRKTTSVANVEDLRAKVVKFFPAYAYLLDPKSAFGQDVAQTLANAVKFDYQAPRLEGELRGTTYYKTVEASARQFDAMMPQDQARKVDVAKRTLLQKYGNLGFDDATLNDLALTVARKDLDQNAASQLAFSASFRKSTGAKAAVAAAMQSPEAASLKTLARSYSYNLTDDEVKSVLTGQPTRSGVVMTQDSLTAKMKSYVKGMLPHLSNQIDADLTLEDIGGGYKKYAADTLELDPNSIDMLNGPFLKAFGNAEKGQMSLGDWITTLKSDPTFGYQHTKQANRDASTFALSIAKMFGKVK